MMFVDTKRGILISLLRDSSQSCGGKYEGERGRLSVFHNVKFATVSDRKGSRIRQPEWTSGSTIDFLIFDFWVLTFAKL